MSSAPPPPMVIRTGAPLDAPRSSSSPAIASTLAGSTTTRFVPRLLDPQPRRARVALPLLPPPSPLTWWRSCPCTRVLHGDAAWSTATAPVRQSPPHQMPHPPSPLHPSALAGYRSSPPSRPWQPVMSCFKCFRRIFQCFIWMLRMLQWLYTHVTNVCFML